MATVPIAKKVQTSRKGKKAWRKNVDVSDVTAGLDQLREEIIQGYQDVASECLQTY
jgi:nucleolar protein 53